MTQSHIYIDIYIDECGRYPASYVTKYLFIT